MLEAVGANPGLKVFTGSNRWKPLPQVALNLSYSASQQWPRTAAVEAAVSTR